MGDMIMSKEEVVKQLQEIIDSFENAYDENLEKMAGLHDQIEALKGENSRIHKKMKDLAEKLIELKNQ
jgi:predicted nuclease with TOPRIM domain